MAGSGLPISGLSLYFLAIVLLILAVFSGPSTAERKGPAWHIGSVAKRLMPESLRHRYQRLIDSAGSPRDVTLERFVGLKVLGFLIFFAPVLLVRPWPWLLATPAGAFLPDLWLERKSSERRRAIRRDLPDTLDMLMITVEAGLGFDAAIMRVTDNLTGALHDEFSRMSREIQLGRSRGEALDALCERANVAELNSFALAIKEADSFGISIRGVLHSLSRDMRTQRRQRAEEMAMKAPVKLIFPLILCIFPAILVIVVGPAVIRISGSLGGG